MAAPKQQTKASIAIDLGTAYCCVGTWISRKRRIEIIQNDVGERFTPTCIAFTEQGILFGNEAKNQASRNTENTIFNVMRLIGRKLNIYKLCLYNE